MSDTLISLAWIGTCLVLVVSALASRRLGGAAWLRLVAIWAAIFGGGWLLVVIARRVFDLPDFT